MTQPVESPPIPLEETVSRILGCAIKRLEAEASRLGTPASTVQLMIVNHTLNYLEKSATVPFLTTQHTLERLEELQQEGKQQ